MKHKHQNTHASITPIPRWNLNRGWLVAAAALSFAVAGTASAANISRADTAPVGLNLPAAWVGGVSVPGSGDVAVWDSSVVTPANALAPGLGAATSWAGIQILGPSGPVVIPADGNTLTLGASGIDMSAATQGLSLGCSLAFTADQTINVASGMAFTNSGAITGVNNITKTGAGIWNAAIGGNATYSGSVTLAGGVTQLGVITTQILGTGPVTLTNGAQLTFLSGNTGDPGTGGTFTNTLIIPTNTTATIWDGARNGSWSSPLVGGGTLNLRVNYVRGDYVGVATNFYGQLNVTSKSYATNALSTDDFRINEGGATNIFLVNAKVNLAPGVNMYQSANPPNGGTSASTTSQWIGELAGSAGSYLLGNPVSGRHVIWEVGFLNTSSEFDGVLGNSTGDGGLMKVGTGTLTLGGYSNAKGTVAVVGGRLLGVTGGGLTVALSTSVKASAAFGVLVSPLATQWTATNMIFQTGSTNEFDFAGSTPSTTTAPMLVVGNLCYSNGVSVVISGGNWAPGTYPLVKYSSLTNGSGFAGLTLVSLPARVTGTLFNDTANNQIDLVVSSATQPLSWATGSATWDTSTPNWVDTTLAAATYTEASGFGDSVQFEDTHSAGGAITVTLNSTVVPTGVKVNTANSYTFSGTGGIGGVAGLTKTGSGTLTLATANSFTGGANLNGGVTIFSSQANLGASTSPVIFGGGTLQYSGNTDDISSRPVIFNAGGATINTAGNNVNFTNVVGSGGAGGLTKIGAGTLSLNGTNRYTGPTIVGTGTLVLQANTYITNSSSITVSNAAVLDATLSGLTLGGVVGQTLNGVGAVSGSVSNIANTTISPGYSGPGTLTFNNNLTLNAGTLVLDVSTNIGASDRVIVSGTLALNGGTVQINASTLLTNGTYKLIQYSALSGAAANLTLAGFSQSGKLASLSSATAGEIDLVVKGQAGYNQVWNGLANNLWDEETSLNWTTNNGVTQSIFIDGDSTRFDDNGSAAPSIAIAAAVLPGAVNVSNNVVTPYIFTDGVGGGGGKISGSTGLTKDGSGTLILDAIDNNSGPTVINAGTVQVGDGNSTGDIGTGNITNNSVIVFDQTDNRSVVGAISGSGSLTQQGSTILTLTASNSYTGQTIINNGTLQVGNNGATGTLGFGPITNAGTLLINRTGSLTITNGITGSQSGGGAAQLMKVASGTLTLGGTNTYEGNTYISNGIVKMAGPAALPNGGTTSGWLIMDGGVASAGTLDLNGFSETVNSLSGVGGTVNGVIENNAVSTTSVLTVNCTAVTTYAGLIKDNGGTGGTVQLVLNGPNTFTLNNANSSYSGGTIVEQGQLNLQLAGSAGSGPITLGNGAILNMSQSSTPSQFPGNTIVTMPNSIVTLTSANLANSWSGVFTCADATSTNDFPLTGSGSSISGPGVPAFGGFPGTVQLDASGTIRFLDGFANPLNTDGGANTRFVINGSLGSRNGVNIYLGELWGNGTLNGCSVPGTTAQGTIYNIGSKGTDCQFDGTINGTLLSTTALVKSGGGRLTLTGGMAYDGSTTVSNGVIALVDPVSFDTSPTINLEASTAVIDVSARADTSLNISSAQTLNGIGTINGNLAAVSGSTVNVGLGTLNVTNVATIAGTLTMELNSTNAVTCSKLTAQSLTITAPLTVTNVGPSILNGTTFHLFSGPTTGFASVTLPAADPTTLAAYVWANNLATLGSITLTSGGTSPILSYPTNISYTVSGSTLHISWPADHLGWELAAQTNTLATGLSGNWVTNTGTAGVTSTNLTINPANGAVFYKLVHP